MQLLVRIIHSHIRTMAQQQNLASDSVFYAVSSCFRIRASGFRTEDFG